MPPQPFWHLSLPLPLTPDALARTAIASVSWCVEDPCTCCTYEVTACVPACCAGEIPTLVDCRKGFFGRKILTYKFLSCDHCVDVVITKFGRTIVRD